MPKSICIKTNKSEDISYILEELAQLKLDNVYFSCKNFKHFTNIIIHYKGISTSLFLYFISKILTYLVLDLYENLIIKKLISLEYFYFSMPEQNEIFNICIDNLNYEDSLDRFESIQNSFFDYLKENKSVNLNGFINFRLFNYNKYLDSIIDICVNKFIVDKEYLEFVNLLKSYISSTQSSTRRCSFDI